jgi:hypothetical protein
MSPRAESEFPQGSVLCVRRQALEDFIRERVAPPRPEPVSPKPLEQPVKTRERTTFFMIIAALSKEAKIDISKASKAGETIAALIAAMGYEVAPNTIARHLRLLAQTLSGTGRQSPPE